MDTGTFQLVRAEVHDLTPEFAQAFHDLTASPTERAINDKRLTYLREKAAASQLVTFQWAKAKLGDQWVRVNGQHSSQVLVDLTATGQFPAGLRVHLDEYEVSGPHGLAVLFRQFDARKSGRSSADVAGAYQNIIPALHDVARPIGKLAIDGITWYRIKVEKAPTPRGDDQYILFHDKAIHEFVKWMGEVISIKTPEMKPQAVVGAMYSTFDAHQDEARMFWESVARGGDEYDETAPATVLDRWLKDAKKEGADRLTPAQLYQGCVHAYNAYRKGQPLKSIKYDFKAYPEPIGLAA